MPIVPVRGLSDQGIITDVDPYNLQGMAWSTGVNVRFSNGSILRAPVFRTVDSLAQSDPRFVTSHLLSTGLDRIIIGYLNGRLYNWSNGSETNVSISGYSDSSSETPYTSVSLGDVHYVNRSDRVPWSYLPAGSAFATLANWDSNWRARLLKSCGGALVALGITKSGTSYPTMVKTSEFAEAGAVPTTWDETDPSNNATENILGEMSGPIVDAANLGELLIIYGYNEAWAMQADGSENVFRYEPLFKDAGALNANCVVEVDRKHYVFGMNDIWMHDGVSKVSICNKRVRDFIFQNINIAEARRCFVSHNPALKEIRFNYVSGDALVTFINGTGCNRAAVFHYGEGQGGVWSFYDLPFIHSFTHADIDTTATYDTVSETYETIGGTFLDLESSIKKTNICVGDVAADYGVAKSLYAFDPVGPGSTVAYAIDTNATRGWQLIREGIDLDEIGAELRGYKCLDSVYPQARLEAGAEPIEFSFGSADYFNQAVEYTDWQTYDGDEFYKLDFRSAGRYLSMKMRHQDTSYVNITGFDFDVDILGDR